MYDMLKAACNMYALWGEEEILAVVLKESNLGKIKHGKKIEQYKYAACFVCNGKTLEDF